MTANFVSTVLSSQRFKGSPFATHRLDSWKEIARYFGRGVRTVQLWEKREGLPIHRHFHRQLGSIFAFCSELDAWRDRASGKIRDPQAEAAGPSKTSKATRHHITIRVQPLHKKSICEHHALCDAIVAKTIVALEQLNPEQLSVEPTQLPLEVDSQGFAQCVSEQSAADYILKWDVQDDGGSLSATAELMLVETEAVVWSHIYRCHPRKLHEMPSYLADQIVKCIWLTVISSPASRPVTRRREKPGARAAYLKGRYFWNQRSEDGLRKAIHYFEAAVQEDPQFALPYSGIADSLTLLSFYEIVPPSEAMPAASRAALRAIELDPDLAEAHASRADILFHFERDWQGADLEYRRAIQCNPRYALGYQWYANLLAAKGQHEAAHVAIMHALEINPVSLITLVWAGVTSHLAHHFDEAIRHYQSALELDPDFIWTHMYLAQALEQKGRLKEAVREFETAIKLAGGSNSVLAMKAHTHAVAGDKASARHILSRLKSATNHKCMPSYDIAATYAALGEPRQMGMWLNRACIERNMKVFSLIQDPRFDSLRHRSEFKEVVDHVGLAHTIQSHSGSYNAHAGKSFDRSQAVTNNQTLRQAK